MLPVILSINKLSIGYEKPILPPITFDVIKGEKLLICGSNGVGKTTLLKNIIGIEKPISGTVKYFEKASIAYCKQDSLNIDFPITAYEVVKMGTYKQKSNSEFIESCMKKTGCYELKNRLFNTLSGGERQRVSLARALCQNSPLLLLDEPSSFLDKQTKQIFIQLLQKLNQEPVTVIAVTHDEEIIKALNWKILRLGEKKDV